MKIKSKSVLIVTILLMITLISIFLYSNNTKNSNKNLNNTLIKPIIIGYAQLGSESAWRNANTASVKQAAQDYGINLIFKNAEGDQKLQKQIIQDFVLQQVDVIIFPPLVVDGWDSVLKEAKEAKIPVIVADRDIKTKDPSLYTVSIGSDFFAEGKKAGQWLVDNVEPNKTINVLEIRGLADSTPTVDRAKGFRQVIKNHPNIKIIDSGVGDFIRAKGNLVMASMLKKYGKKINVVYSHNDDMALGVIDAIQAYGLKPGKDILIISVDGEKAALQAIKDGKSNVSVECTPLLGPVLMQTVKKLVAGESVPKRIVSEEKVFTIQNVDKELPLRTY